jgi:hypothetical protein
MRYREFATPLNEGPLDDPEDISAYNNVSDHVEDDADHESDAALMEVLREIQFAGAEEPKISVKALLQLVNNKPGGESFDKFALEKAKGSDKFKELISKIEPNNEGIEYVFIEPPEPIEEPDGEMGVSPDAKKSASTVSSMASRALGSRS